MAAKRPLVNYAGTAQELAPGDIVAEAFNTPDVFADFVVSGLLSPTSANLTSTLSAGVAYVIGRRVVVAATANTYTASQDTYVDLSNTGVLTYVAVALGAAAPALTANSLRLQKVVTDATAVTSVVQLATTKPVITSENLLLGLTGVRLKNSAGELVVRNAGDTADAPLKASAITLTGAVSTNTVYAGPGAGAAAPPAFRGLVHNDFAANTYISASGSTQSIAAGTFTALIFPTETNDTLSEYNNTTGAFTPQASGLYLCWVSLESATSGIADQRILVSIATTAGSEGERVLNAYTNSSATNDVSAAKPTNFVGGGTYYFNVYCSSAEVLAGGEACSIRIKRIG